MSREETKSGAPIDGHLSSLGVMDVALDMETGDPDDVLALLYLLAEPRVALRCVTVFKGSPDQVGLVRSMLQRGSRLAHCRHCEGKVGGGVRALHEAGCARIPVGSLNLDTTKRHLSRGLPRLFGETEDASPDADSVEVLLATIKQYPSLTMITGAPLSAVHRLLRDHPEVVIQRLVAQGGFAGSRCVLPENQLPKFKDKEVMSTWNFGGDIPAARFVLGCDRILTKLCVSKDVCHGVIYNAADHEAMTGLMRTDGAHPAWSVFFTAMDRCVVSVVHSSRVAHVDRGGTGTCSARKTARRCTTPLPRARRSIHPSAR